MRIAIWRVTIVFLGLGLALSLCSLSGVMAADPPAGPVAQPSPRPPVSSTPTSGGDSRGGAPEGPGGAITGRVFDLSTNAPGAGIEVSVNEAIVRTDREGRYSITGLPSGEYMVLLRLPAEWRPAQGPVSVSLDGRHGVTVDLAYYSQPPPAATPTLTALLVAPATLPEAGGAANAWLPVIAGLLLVLGGGVLFTWSGD